MVILEGVGVSYERGTPIPGRPSSRASAPRHSAYSLKRHMSAQETHACLSGGGAESLSQSERVCEREAWVGWCVAYLHGPPLARRDQLLAIQDHLVSCNTHQLIKLVGTAKNSIRFNEKKITKNLHEEHGAIVEHVCRHFRRSNCNSGIASRGSINSIGARPVH